MNSNFNKLFSIMQDNNNLIQQQIGYQKELFSMVKQKLSNLSVANDVIKVDLSNSLQAINKTLRVQANGQFEIANKIISNINENKELLTRSEEHTSELQSLMRNSYAVSCLKKKK